MDAIYHKVTKKSRFGATKDMNYADMIISFVLKYVECIPAIKGLVKRLHDDIALK